MSLSHIVSRSRHKWFPLAVVIVTLAWWLWRVSLSRYQTLYHLVALLVSALLVALWFYNYGGVRKRTRKWVAAGVVIASAVFLISFRPVYNGDMGVYRWRLRFARSPDESLQQLHASGSAAGWQATARDYPAFLGGGYWPEVKDVVLETDWRAHPPQEMWRHEIGAGWSAFAIVGDFAVTQEQRAENELVTCYRVTTGEPVWTHSDKTRFDPADPIGGLGDVGPRATPTIVGKRIFTQGGTGIVNCLDARDGHAIWSHDTAAEFGAPIATWGKAGSPLVFDDVVVISVGAPSAPASFDSSLVAFDIETGALRWHAGNRKAAYATPVYALLAGEKQIVVVNESWLTGHRASDGKVLWEYPWGNETDTSASCSQPVPLGGDQIFVSKGYGVGCALLGVSRKEDGTFAAEPSWQPPIKKVMKSKFSNVVFHEGRLYGLDDVLLECAQPATGEVLWKNRRQPAFGHGQIMLIGDMILVLSETGELALVRASPQGYEELAELQGLDAANPTWNNPAFSSPYLLIRNSREAACYQLPVK